MKLRGPTTLHDSLARAACHAGIMARLFAAGLMLGATASGLAQTYPAKPIRLIVPFVPGGPSDMIARSLSQRMNETWGQPVVVENRGGAGGNIGMELGAKAPPDGYTLVIGNIGTLAINASVYSRLPYDPVRDFTPIALVAGTPLILVTHPSLPARTLRELAALAKQRPGQINFASAGSGGPTHLAGELFNMLSGIKLVHVPYKGNAPAITALVSGEAQMMFSSPMNPAPFVKAGRLRALAVTYERRIAAMPEVPTVAEAGVPGLEVSGWYGVLGPAHLPRDVIGRLNNEVVRIATLPEVKEYYLVQGIEPMHSTPDEFAAHIKREIARWGNVARVAGARAD